jgi:hypothetical protein
MGQYCPYWLRTASARKVVTMAKTTRRSRGATMTRRPVQTGGAQLSPDDNSVGSYLPTQTQIERDCP